MAPELTLDQVLYQRCSPSRQVDAVEEVGEALLVREPGERVEGQERHREPGGEQQTWGGPGSHTDSFITVTRTPSLL